MSQSCIINLWMSRYIANRTREQASVFKQYYQTQTPKKNRIPRGKATQQATDSLNHEKTLRNGILKVAVVKKFTHRLNNVFIDRKGRSFNVVFLLATSDLSKTYINISET